MIFNKYKVTSLFGKRELSNGDDRFHNGIDLIGLDDIHILSPVSGIVISSRIIKDETNLTSEWGEYICVQSNDGYKHYFCHLASRWVTVGATVSKNTILGIMGSTGYCLGTHTHYGIRDKHNNWIDPLLYYNIKLKENVVYYIKKELTVYDAIEILIKKVHLEIKTIEYLSCYKYADDLIKKLANAIILKTEPFNIRELDIKEAIAILKQKAKLEDKTINFLLCYKYGDELVKKLANAM